MGTDSIGTDIYTALPYRQHAQVSAGQHRQPQPTDEDRLALISKTEPATDQP
jgi:hypothetical protein